MVGRLIVGTANLEAFLFVALAGLLDDGDIASAILVKIDKISAKWAIVLSVAKLMPKHPISSLIVQNEAPIAKALKVRNRLAHSLYGVGPNSEIILISGALSTRRGQVEESFDTAMVRSVCDDLREAVRSINAACDGLSVNLRGTSGRSDTL